MIWAASQFLVGTKIPCQVHFSVFPKMASQRNLVILQHQRLQSCQSCHCKSLAWWDYQEKPNQDEQGSLILVFLSRESLLHQILGIYDILWYMCLHAMRHHFFKWVAQISLVYNTRWWFQTFLLTLGKIPMLIYIFQVGWLDQHRCWCTSRPRSFRFCTWCILVATRLSNIAPFPSWWCWYWEQLECRRWGYGDQITGWFHWNQWEGLSWGWNQLLIRSPLIQSFNKTARLYLSLWKSPLNEISDHNRIRTLVTISTVGYGDQVGLRRHRFDCHAIWNCWQVPISMPGKLVGAVQNLTLTIDMSDCQKMLENTGSKRTSILEICWILVESRWRCFTARSFLVFLFLWWVPLLGRRRAGGQKWVDVERMLGFADIDPEQPPNRLPGNE